MAKETTTRTKRRWLLSASVLVLAAVLWLPGCAGRKAVGDSALDRTSELRAEQMLRQARQEHSLHRDRRTLEIAYDLIDRYPAYTHNDEAMLLAARSAQRLEDRPAWRRLTNEFLEKFPDSRHLDDGLALAGDLAAAEGDTLAAADYRVRVYDRRQGAARTAALAEATALLDRLSADELQALADRHGDSGLYPYISFLATRRLLEEGRREEASENVERLRDLAPESEWAIAAEKLLSEPGYRRVPGRRTYAGAADEIPTRLGVLCPLTGRYAVLGNAFLDGALMARDKINTMGWRNYEITMADTRGDPVDAALEMRRLIDEEGVMAVIGSLLSSPTAAAALVADDYGVPLLSPTATNERIWELGPGIFQTNLTGLFEARLLARLATNVLLKKRFAVLYPETQAGARSFEVFAEEVAAGGGAVVAAAAFDPHSTDFRRPILQLKEARPEVIFVDASVDEMVLLGPQLDFYRVGAVVMGPSSWNSPKLQREVGTVMERALFPSDTALFPAEWLTHFETQWDDEQLPAEATPLALKAYQATMLVLDSLAREGLRKRHDLTTSLRTRLGDREVETTDPVAFAATVRMFRDGEVIDFPADLFIATWPVVTGVDFDPELDPELDAAEVEMLEERVRTEGFEEAGDGDEF